MNVWCNLSTIFNQRRVLQIAGLLTLCVALITTLFFGIAANAAPGVNQTLSFQGRLLTPQGQPVADGFYNIQFKIYQDGTGAASGNPNGTLKWTETYLNNGANNGVKVKNGYFSAELGSQTPFGTSVDWNQDTLWLSMNIAGSSTLCSAFGTSPCLADGEMLPMKRLTAAPYALNAGKVGGKSVDELIQNSTTQQTGNFNISGTGIANILQGSSGIIGPMLDRADAGALTIGSSQATSIVIGSATGSQTIDIGSGAGNNSVTIGSSSGTSQTTIQGGSGGVAVRIGSGASFGIYNSAQEALLSVEDNGSLTLAGNATVGGTITSEGDLMVLSADGSKSAGITWGAGNDTARLGSTGATVALQGNALDILTATNANGQARVGIGNNASSGYALDVTGVTNVSDGYSINGVSVLNNTSLTFSDTGTATITAGSGQGLQLNADGGIAIGDGTASGDPTLLTLDKATAAPAATGDAILGSMYYDTTLGKVQCYEADGWGACSSSPDNFVTLSPEYTNAVTNGTGIGSFTSDICSDTLNINDGTSGSPTICGANETFNFYNWTSEETSAQTKDIYVTYQLPGNFTGFVDGSTSLVGRTDSSAAAVTYQVYKNTSSGLVSCGSVVSVSTGAQTTWQKATASGSADPANCNFSANDSLVFKITLSAEDSSNAYASTLSFAFSDN